MGRPESRILGEDGVAQLAKELRAARDAVGMSQRQIACITHYSPAAVSRATNGQEVPSWNFVVKYLRACGADPKEWRARWELAAEERSARKGPPSGTQGRTTSDVEFGVLGPLRVTVDGRDIGLGSGKLRALLAFLLINANRVVSAERLIDVLWEDSPPSSAMSLVPAYVSRLRTSLGTTSVARVGTAYRLTVEPERLDSMRFTQRVTDARARLEAGELAEAARLYRSGLDEWRGEALMDIPGLCMEAERARLAETRLSATKENLRVVAELGRLGEVIAEISRLTEEHPFDEELHRLWMTVLYRSGRAAEALSVYHRYRRRVIDELGLEPGPELGRIQEAILSHNMVVLNACQGADAVRSAGTATGRAEQAVTSPVPRPRQLPLSITTLVGREQELGMMDLLMDSDAAVCLVTGLPGAGKTSLVTAWARRRASHFPDGQLFANLERQTEPLEVLGAFLRALGVREDVIPDAMAERAALYRSVLADKRMLVLLDGASSASEVEPLLPGSTDSLTVVTSRRHLDELAVTHDTLLVRLDTLTQEAGVAMLEHLLGRARVRAEPEQAARIVQQCGAMPLALSLIATRLRDRPSWTLSQAAERLATAGSQVGAALAASFASLTSDSARLLRLIARHPAADTPVTRLAALAGTSPQEAQAQLRVLESAHLVTEPQPNRYRCHPLIRRLLLGEGAQPA
ncbi:BTAD domain-containing putative transcriptional regulator [Streptomyces sp. 4N509B]|uniref:BTAD domain-containing putative transcriptional regulator n=1 Tax=Streptomyces sp. 4N509B TaxID=3457413 RepID=UPI003FCF0801